MDRNKELKVHRLRLPGRSLCSIRSNRKWCKRRGSSLQCQNCFFVYPIIDCNLKNFTSVKGKKFSFSAGSSNKVKVDLVHKGTIVQTVVSSWTISAGGSKSHTITADDLGGYSNSDKFYFRFNSSPIGNRYSISGYFG